MTEPTTVALDKVLRRTAREAARTYVGTHWPSMETLRSNGLTSEFTEAGDGERIIRRFLSTFSPEFVADLLDRLADAEARETALRWALRNDGGECPADDPAGYAEALRALIGGP